MRTPRDSFDEAIGQLAADENRVERFAPARAPIGDENRAAGLAPWLYLALGVRTLGETGMFAIGGTYAWRYAWPSTASVVAVSSEIIVAALLFASAYFLWTRRRTANLVGVLVLILRSALTAFETLIRLQALWTQAPVLNVVLVRYAFVVPFESIVPVLLLGLFARSAVGGRLEGGRCRRCGYKTYGLRGDRCPECGDMLNVGGRQGKRDSL